MAFHFFLLLASCLFSLALSRSVDIRFKTTLGWEGGATVEKVYVGGASYSPDQPIRSGSFVKGTVLAIQVRKQQTTDPNVFFGVWYGLDYFARDGPSDMIEVKIGSDRGRINDWRCWGSRSIPPTNWWTSNFRTNSSWVTPVYQPSPRLNSFPRDSFPYFWLASNPEVMYCRSRLPGYTPGNGIVEYPETCDDGNFNVSDGCTWDGGRVQPGFFCPFPGRPCQACPVGSNCRLDSTGRVNITRCGSDSCLACPVDKTFWDFPFWSREDLYYRLAGHCTHCTSDTTLEIFDNGQANFQREGQCIIPPPFVPSPVPSDAFSFATDQTTVTEDSQPSTASSTSTVAENADGENAGTTVPGWAIALLVIGCCILVLLVALVAVNVKRM